ncbi:MAG: aminopeptidase P family protein [Candidatus Omnitrophica bacterium]|nr:aminopeptidase P family protein [Candidatus Omnitrophota bacterium]
MPKHISTLKSNFHKHQINAYLINRDVNIRYLTGFPASESWFLVTSKQDFYITDGRYKLEAQKGLPKSVKVQLFENSKFEESLKLAHSQGVKVLGYDSRYVTVFEFSHLERFAKKAKIKLKACNNLVEDMRAIKTPEEVDYIRQALQIHQKVLSMLKRRIKPGLTEKDILIYLKKFIETNNTNFSFDSIIASGGNSCYPHALVTERKILDNEAVLVDIGFEYKGYKSDLTRMFVLGRIAELQKEVIEHVRQAQACAIRIIRDGVPVAEVDRQARNYLEKNGLAKYFCHSTGHGVGLEIHEAPALSSKSDAVLRAGMVVTVEPGVYIPGKFGVRLEEMILVKKQEGELLSGNFNQ